MSDIRNNYFEYFNKKNILFLISEIIILISEKIFISEIRNSFFLDIRKTISDIKNNFIRYPNSDIQNN